MAKESTVGIRINTGNAKSDIAQLTASVISMARSFEQSNEKLKAQRATMDATTKLLVRMSQASTINTQSIRTESAANAALKANLDILRSSMAANTREMTKASQARKGLSDGMKDLGSSLGQAKNASDKLGGSMASTGGIIQKMFQYIGAATALRLVSDTLGKFEYTMKQVQFVTKATGEEFQKLNNLARELGATTQYTASDAAAGMRYLGLAGLKTTEILTAIPGVLNMATAASMDLAQSADIVSKILKSFSMEASQTGRIGDVLVQTMTNTNTTVEQLGQALKFAAPLASAANISFEESAAILGTVANAGIQASMAGTGFRRVIQSFIAPAPRAKKAFEILGLSMEDMSLKTNSMIEIIRKLKDAGMESLPELGVMIADVRGGPFLQALTANLDTYEEMIKKNDEANGVAKEGADILNNTLRGAFKALTSAIQEATLKIGDSGLLGAMRSVTDISTGVVRNLIGMSQATDKFANSVTVASAVVRGFIAAGVLKALIKIAMIIASIGGTGTGLFAGPLGWITTGIVAMSAFLPQIEELGSSLLGLGEKAPKTADALQYVSERTKESGEVFLSAKDHLIEYSGAMKDLSLSGADMDTSLVDSLNKGMERAVSNGTQLQQTIKDTVEATEEARYRFFEAWVSSDEVVKKLGKTIEETTGWSRAALMRQAKAQKQLNDRMDEASTSASKLFYEFTLIEGMDVFNGIAIDAQRAADSIANAWAATYAMSSAGMGLVTEGQSSAEAEEKAKKDLEIKQRAADLWLFKLRESEDQAFKIQTEAAEAREALAAQKPFLSAEEFEMAQKLTEEKIKSLYASMNKSSDAEAKKFIRDRERLTDQMTKVILPVDTYQLMELRKDIEEAQRLGVDSSLVKKFSMVREMEIEQNAIKSFVEETMDLFEEQEKAGTISKGVVVEGLQTLLFEVERGTPLFNKITEAINKMNEAMDKDVEAKKKAQLESLDEALAAISNEFYTSKFEVLTGEDLSMQRSMLEELLDQALKSDQTIEGMPEKVRKIRNEIDGLRDPINLAKEATMEWARSLETGITQAIIGAKSLSDALADVVNKMAEFLIQQALFGSGGLLGGVFGGFFGGLGGGTPAVTSPVVTIPGLVTDPKTSPNIGPNIAIPQQSKEYGMASTGSYSPSIVVNVNMATSGEMDQEQAAKMGKAISDIIEIKQAEFMRKQQRSGGAMKRAYSGVVL